MPPTITSECRNRDFRPSKDESGVNKFASPPKRRAAAGVTLLETVISLMVTVIGLAGLFATSAQCYSLLRRAKEIVAVREDILCRLDTIRTLSYSELAKSSYLSSTLMVSGTAGDATPFGMTTSGMKNFTEKLTVYALGKQLFSNAAALSNATPDVIGEFASQIDTVAPAAPKTYRSTSLTKGAWTLQVANALPYIQVNRVGTGANAVTTIVTAGDLTSYAQLRVDVTFTWTDSNNVTRTQVGSTIVSNSGSLL